MINRNFKAKPYAVQANLNDLQTSGRRAEIARRLIAGEHKQDIIDFLMETFGMEYKQAWSEYKQGYTYIYLQCELTKDEIRKLNLSKLEELWDRAEEDADLTGKAYYSTQLKNIDTVNKTAGLYEPEEDHKSVGDFTINLGTINTNKTQKTETSDDSEI